MSISSLVLELWQFSFIRDWPEIRKSEIPPSEFCPISGDWGELWIPNLARMSLIECYWMLQISRVTAFTVFELLRKKPTGGGVNYPSPRLGLRSWWTPRSTESENSCWWHNPSSWLYGECRLTRRKDNTHPFNKESLLYNASDQRYPQPKLSRWSITLLHR